MEKAARELLPKDVGERVNAGKVLRPFKTGRVLECEFNLIHGEDRWDPPNPGPQRAGEQVIDREKFITKANEYLPDDAAEAKRLALHAWSAAKLPGAGQAALCLSGGGIRNAAFALGILQGLARRNLLRQFHYLSTVSGGGYIGSWLTAWRHREANGDEALPRLRAREFGEFTESTPMQRLRFNQNFLTPKIGLASADTWAAIRNLLLNWLVFLPLLGGLLIAPRIVQSFLVWMQQHDANLIPHSSLTALFSTYLWLPPNRGERMLRVADLGGWAGWRSWTDSLAVALILLGFCTSAYNRPANARATMTQTRFVLWVVCPVMAGAVLLTAALATWVNRLEGSGTELLRWVFFGAAVYILARMIAAFLAFFRGGKVPAFDRRVFLQFLLELIGWAVAGMCTGLLIGLAARLCHSMALSDPYELAKYLAVYGPPWIVLSFLCGEATYVGVTSRLPDSERDREWLGRAGGWFAIFVVGYFVFSWLVLFGWQWVHQAGLGVRYLVVIGGSGLLSIFGALAPLTRATAASASKQRLPITGIVAVLAGLFVLGASAILAQGMLDFVGWLGRILHENFRIAQISDLPDRTFEPLTELGFVVATCVLLR